MIHLKIDSVSVSVPEGTTVLEAAKTVNISIPSMCYKQGYSNHPSCMICLIKDKKTGNLITSCALKATEGMEIITNDADVVEARKEALELLLSDHVGDCEAPCSLSCPANMNIPLMNRLIAEGRFNESLKVVKEDIALPYILGYICPAPCEKACRRKQVDDAVSICMLKRFVAAEDEQLNNEISKLPSIKKKNKKVAIIGTGAAGLASAYYLLKDGYACVLFDKNEKEGGAMQYSIPDDQLPKNIIDTEINLIRNYGGEFKMNTVVTTEYLQNEIRPKFDAVIIATGDITQSNTFPELFKFNKTGITIEEGTYATSETGIFACGSVLRSQKMAVRAVAQGKATALSAIKFMNGEKAIVSTKKFNSRFDKLVESEFEEYLKESITDRRISPKKGHIVGFSKEEAIIEAKRCMHCDCRKMDNCKLRDYSDEYKADRKKYFPEDRKKVTKHFQHSDVVYETEKCIRCGLCVDITSKSKEATGLTFIGRGFDVHIDIPFGRTLDEGLTNTAGLCVQSCPTGALSFKEKANER